MPFLKKALIIGNKILVKIDNEKENCPKQVNEWILKQNKWYFNNILCFSELFYSTLALKKTLSTKLNKILMIFIPINIFLNNHYPSKLSKPYIFKLSIKKYIYNYFFWKKVIYLTNWNNMKNKIIFYLYLINTNCDKAFLRSKHQ